MNIPADIRYTEELLRDAMELLEDMRLNMSSFDRARFWHLKKHFDQNEAINKDLRKALNDIDTQERIRRSMLKIKKQATKRDVPGLVCETRDRYCRKLFKNVSIHRRWF